MIRTTYGAPVRDVDVPLLREMQEATRAWSELNLKADAMAKELRAARRAERAAWKRCRAASELFEATISGKVYRDVVARHDAATRRSLERPTLAPAPTWHPLVVAWLFREAARELFARLFIRYAGMRAVEPWAMITQVWEIRILRALDSVSGTGWRYEWNANTGHWAIYEPSGTDGPGFDDDEPYPVTAQEALV